ncbi:MAG: glycine--tRNA ligase [Candidatus Gracilibacteria bacterium]
MANVEMKDLVELSKVRGFVYQGSEIYGGLANSWDYGPYGSMLKENIKNAWIREFVQKRPDMTLLDAAIMMNPNVWVASGHVGGFSDPLMECKDCHTRHRADKLVEEALEKDVNFPVPANWAGDKTPNEDFDAYINLGHIACPNCGKKNWSGIQRFNLMLSTHQGVTEDSTSLVYLRPETAQGIFVNFANIARTSRKKVPFGVAQCGKAFRNEITPKNFIFRTREFEQIEIEFFCKPGTDEAFFEEWLKEEQRFFTEVLGFDTDKVRFVEIPKEGLPHYSRRAGDFEYLFPFGWGEISTLANRTDYDLKAHMTLSKADLSYFDPFTNEKYIPYVIEPSIGLSRLTLAALSDAYTRIETEEGSRIVMKFAPSIAPIKIAILPLVKKLGAEAMEIYKLLSPYFMCEYDETGAIGKRYYRMDEIGVPFSICVDSDNYNQGQLTIRDRDTGLQETVKIENLVEYFRNKGC